MMKFVVTFLCGALFGAFVIINLWQPKLEDKKEKKIEADLKIKRFDKDFDTRDLKKKGISKNKTSGDALNQDLIDMQKQMQDAFKQTGSIFKMMEDSIQNGAAGAVGMNIGEIVEKYTADAVILEMDVANIDNSTLNIEVKNGQVMISGEARIEQKEGGTTRMMVSSFSRSVSVPEGTKASGLQIENVGKDKLQMIFPKEK